jgi:hypothetical protein
MYNHRGRNRWWLWLLLLLLFFLLLLKFFNLLALLLFELPFSGILGFPLPLLRLPSNLLNKRVHSLSTGLCINLLLLFLSDLNDGCWDLFLDLNHRLDNLNLGNRWLLICIFGLPFYLLLFLVFFVLARLLENVFALMGRFYGHILDGESWNLFELGPPVHDLFFHNSVLLLVVEVNNEWLSFLLTFFLLSLLWFDNNLSLLLWHCTLMRPLLLLLPLLVSLCLANSGAGIVVRALL